MVICDPPIRLGPLGSESHLFVEGGEEPSVGSLGDFRSSWMLSCKLGSWREDARGGEPSFEFCILTLMPPCTHALMTQVSVCSCVHMAILGDGALGSWRYPRRFFGEGSWSKFHIATLGIP